jgi:2-polyprenyl-3-methyl-5-hydroxy-6-metoxy-1,4-benzoquinol methylase
MEAATIANANGHQVRVGDIVEVDFQVDSFDYIQFWHSLEHCREPGMVLRRARSWLKDTGTIGIAAPNADSLGAFIFGDRWFNLDAPRHLFAFNPTNIIRLLSDCGFHVNEFETYSQLSDWTNSCGFDGSDRTRLLASALKFLPSRLVLGQVQRLAALTGWGEHLRVSAVPTGVSPPSPSNPRIEPRLPCR